MRKLSRNKTKTQYDNVVKSLYRDVTKDQLDGNDTYPRFETVNLNGNVRNVLLDVDNKFCPYCQFRPLSSSNGLGTHIDHFIPKAVDDKKSIEFHNLIPSCGPCNSTKNNLPIPYSPDTKDFSKSVKVILFFTGNTITNILLKGFGKMNEQIRVLNLNRLYNDLTSLNIINQNYQLLLEYRRLGGEIDFEFSHFFLFRDYI